ncbi:MAG: hypothetical protein ACI4TP_01695, partial [Anaerotignum sp.]
MEEKPSKKGSVFDKIRNFSATPPWIAVILLVSAVCITGLVYLITTTKILHVGWKILHAPTMLLLNILPVLLLLLLLFFLTRRLFFSVSCTGVVLVFFAIADRMKVSMRQEPLLPTDLTLVKEVIAILKTFPVYQLVLIGLMLLLFVGLLVLSFIKSKGIPLSPAPRLVGLVLVLACAFGANQLWYADKALYDGYPTVDNPYFQVNQYNTRGM